MPFKNNKERSVCLNLPQSSLDQSLERQVLQSQCRKLEAQNYNLSLTAEQLSHSMGVRFKHGGILQRSCTLSFWVQGKHPGGRSEGMGIMKR